MPETRSTPTKTKTATGSTPRKPVTRSTPTKPRTRATKIALSIARSMPGQKNSKKNRKKKAISLKNKKKRDELFEYASPSVQKGEENPTSTTTGLRLMKRGVVTMSRVSKRVALGKRMIVDLNADGNPVGKGATEMQSYIGVLARMRVPIARWPDGTNETKQAENLTWRGVDKELKNKIWESVQLAFVLGPESRKLVLASANTKWRDFKSLLTTSYVLPYLDNRDLIKTPPGDFPWIEQDDWDIFVASRATQQFSALHTKQKSRRNLNKYDHTMSRKGYARLEAELSVSKPDKELDRAALWVEARTDKSGKYKTADVEKTAQKIDELKNRTVSGELQISGTTDVLTIALGTPEHPGRVRGIGGYVKPSAYFNFPKRRKESMENHVRLSVRAILQEEKEELIKTEKNKWILEERERNDALFAELRAQIQGARGSTVEPSVKGSPKTPVGQETQGSCSHAATKIAALGIANITKIDAELEKEIDVGLDKETKEQLAKGTLEKSSPVEEDCILAIGNSSNIVAHGRVFVVNLAEPQFLHCVQLKHDQDRVCITTSIKPDAKLPFPRGELQTVEDAVGTFVAWPKRFVLPASYEKKVNTNLPVKRKISEVEESGPPFSISALPERTPPSVKALCRLAGLQLGQDSCPRFEVGSTLFGKPYKTFIGVKDIYNFALMKEISSGCILLYLRFLHDVLEKSNMLRMVKFVNPDIVGKGSGKDNSRSRALANSFSGAFEDQIFLIPYNSGKHWTLTVVCPSKETVSFMDPLKRKLPGSGWINVVDNAISMWKAQQSVQTRKKVHWNNIAGIPVQQSSTDCGYYVLRYIRDICNDKEISFEIKWAKRGNSYTQADIDEVRAEWATWVLANLPMD